MFNLNPHEITADDSGFFYRGFFVYDVLRDAAQIFNDFNDRTGDPDGPMLIQVANADAAKVWIDEFVSLH